MHNGGRIVAGVDARKERLGDHGLAQIALVIGGAHAGVHRFLKRTAHDVRVLPHLGKNHGHSRVLADSDALVAGDMVVLQNLFQRGPAGRRRLRLDAGGNGGFHIRAYAEAGFQKQAFDFVRHRLRADFTHTRSPPVWFCYDLS